MVECEEEGGGSQDRLTDVEVRGFTVGLPGGSGGPGVCECVSETWLKHRFPEDTNVN